LVYRKKWLGGQANSGLTAPGSVYGQLLERAKVLFKHRKRSFVFNIFSLSVTTVLLGLAPGALQNLIQGKIRCRVNCGASIWSFLRRSNPSWANLMENGKFFPIKTSFQAGNRGFRTNSLPEGHNKGQPVKERQDKKRLIKGSDLAAARIRVVG
jgi:hypothetical protein